MKRLGGIFLIVTAMLAVSCGKEQEFVGVWQATDTRTGYLLVHQFTFRKDNSVGYCIEMPLQGRTECVKDGGTFTVAEKGQAVVLIGKPETQFTFTKQNRDLYCKELDLHFGLSYK